MCKIKITQFHNSQTISQKIPQRNHFYLYFAGCLNAAFQVFLGCQAGYTILTYQGHLPRLLRFLAWGLVTGGLALLLCQASLNDGWVPINKNLWSTSYALATTSLVLYKFPTLWEIKVNLRYIKFCLNSPGLLPDDLNVHCDRRLPLVGRGAVLLRW